MRVIHYCFGLLIMLSNTTHVFSQQIVRSTFSSFGSSKVNDQLYVSQTAGQSSLHALFTSEGYTLRQGFQQPVSSAQGSLNTLSVLVYPNPNQGSFIMEAELAEQESYILSFFDMNGKVILQTRGIGNRSMNIHFPSNTVPGMYFYQLFTEEGRFTSDKITITP
jgi:hypothetical protein